MTPERRREICALLFVELSKEKVDLRKWRRDVGTEASELGIPIDKATELMKVVSAFAFNEAVQKTAIDPWSVTSLSKEEIYAIAEQAMDARICFGRFDLPFTMGSILRKRTSEEEEKRNAGSFEQIKRINNLGISTEEMLDFFEDNFRKTFELTIAKVRETVAVVVEQGLRA